MGRPAPGHVTRLVIPDRALVVLIGAAGSGKSTLAARHFPPEAVLSSDSFRGRIGRGEDDQAVTRSAFAALHAVLRRRLAEGAMTVVDATNVTAAARAALVGAAARHGAPTVALVMDLPPRTVVARNAARAARIVPEAVVRRHLERLGRADDATLRAEGFAIVHRVRTAEEAKSVEIVLPSQAADPA
jgi:predicted kinase